MLFRSVRGERVAFEPMVVPMRALVTGMTHTSRMMKGTDLNRLIESPLDCKEIQPVHPKGDQSWVFIGGTDVEAETPIFWPPHAES